MSRGKASVSPEARGLLPPWQKSSLLISTACAVLLLLYCWTLVSPDGHDLVYIYFQPLVPISLMLWLWAANVRFFEKKGIKFEALFSGDEQQYLLGAGQIFGLASVATAMVAAAAAAFVMALAVQNTAVASLIPSGLYISLLLLMLCPINALYKSTRLFFADTLRRVLLPVQPVSFSDFLLADILTSLAKALADLQRATCLMATGPTLAGFLPGSVRDPTGLCARSSWHVNAVLALPYILRLVQCVIIHRTTGDTNQLRNAAKYSTVLPVIVLSMVKYHVSHDAWTNVWWKLWILASVVNTTYSYYWDLEMDWDISWFSQCGPNAGCVKFPVIRKLDSMDTLDHTGYKYPYVFYTWAMASNFIMRIAWIYKLSSHLRYNKFVNFFVAMVEVVRRFQWAFLRVECGLSKVAKAGKAGSMVMTNRLGKGPDGGGPEKKMSKKLIVPGEMYALVEANVMTP